MQKIVLISCASKKTAYKTQARKLYVSDLFRKNLQFANTLNPDKIFILSAKHGLLDLDTEIEPYNETLNDMSSGQIKIWAEGVLEKLSTQTDLQKDHFIILAGDKYRKYLVSRLRSYEIPLRGLRIGEQLKFLRNSSS